MNKLKLWLRRKLLVPEHQFQNIRSWKFRINVSPKKEHFLTVIPKYLKNVHKKRELYTETKFQSPTPFLMLCDISYLFL